MAFSIRKIISNISYFSKTTDGESSENDAPFERVDQTHHENSFPSLPTDSKVGFSRVEPDSTSKYATSLSLPISIKNYAAKKGSLSDTDMLNIHSESNNPEKKKTRKLKLDIHNVDDSSNISEDSSANVENTPKHKLLDGHNSDLFKGFNFNQSFDISDAMSDSSHIDNIDIESLSEHTDSESGDTEDGTAIKMCRKVEIDGPSATPESFADVEVDKNEEERLNLLLSYQTKIEKLESVLHRLLQDFKFHIEVSKVFNCKSIVATAPGTDVATMPNSVDTVNDFRGPSPGWNVVLEKDDKETKLNIKNKLLVIRNNIDTFVHTYLQEKPKLTHAGRSNTFNLHKGKRQHKNHKVTHKKKLKHYDFPDLRDALHNLFYGNTEDDAKCNCCCHSDSSVTIKSEQEENYSISSSIGNFTLDSTTLSAYSESLDQIISCSSFQDTSLYSTILQKAAIERITFYIQVHNIQLKCGRSNEFESKNDITFYCPACDSTLYDEHDLLKHILSQFHCEKIHFLYKTAYVKKCIAAGKEIMPSTVLNPMTYYRDENKIVCFGDAVYACSLCFDNFIVGESVLMNHCMDEEHANRRDMLDDIL